jgi:hypothetical protein
MKVKVAATIIAAAFASVSVAGPASANFSHFWWWKFKYFKKHKPPVKGSSGFPLVVGCVMGSAGGLIAASIIKGGGLHYMSQKEFESTPRDKTKELTSQEAAFIGFTCGLGAIPVIASFKQPAAVTAAY